MRKDAGFEVMDNIKVYQSNNDKIKDIMSDNSEEIMSEVLAKDIIFGQEKGFIKEWDINGEKVTLAVEKYK